MKRPFFAVIHFEKTNVYIDMIDFGFCQRFLGQIYFKFTWSREEDGKKVETCESLKARNQTKKPCE